MSISEPAVNRKLEAGLDLSIGDIEMALTAYSERMETVSAIIITRILSLTAIHNRYKTVLNSIMFLSRGLYTDPDTGSEVHAALLQMILCLSVLHILQTTT
jgi:hypothetical protein